MIPSFKHGIIASSRPRVVAAGSSDFTAGEFDFTDINVTSQDYAYSNTVTMTHGGVLAISANNNTNGGGTILKNGVSQNTYSTQAQAEANNPVNAVQWLSSGLWSIINVSTNDTLQFQFYEDFGTGEPYSITITIRNATFSGTVVDTFNWNLTGCFLTTTMVKYMNLQDNGPELTAMRALREHYRNVPGYQEIISEYYQNSTAIITAINALTDPSVEYQYIYNTVIAVKQHVDIEEWQQAHDLYMAMYNDLKSRYLGT